MNRELLIVFLTEELRNMGLETTNDLPSGKITTKNKTTKYPCVHSHTTGTTPATGIIVVRLASHKPNGVSTDHIKIKIT